jgi:flagellar protein FlaI
VKKKNHDKKIHQLKERLAHLHNKSTHPHSKTPHHEIKPHHEVKHNIFHTPPEKNSHEKEIIESYHIETDGAKVEAKIVKDLVGTTYNLHIPEINPATSALLNEIRNELVSLTTISMKELTDPEAFQTIKNRFMQDSINLLRHKLPNIEPHVENFLIGKLMQDMLGLGKIEFLVSDPNLEEIVIPSSTEPIKVYSKKHGWLETNIKIEKEEEIVNYANIIARRVGKQITVLNPLLDAHLITGDRINAVLYPINTKGSTITIRKFARDPFTVVDMITNKTCDLETAALIWLAVEYEMNILFSGGTGSGKTSFLNACMAFVPPNQRIVSIEDTRELMLPEFLYWTPLVTRTPNSEGKGEVSMLDLLVNSLRMRPDRIILGEMRREAEAHVLFEAMHTGHSVYATVHADTASETIARLVNPPLNVPANLLKAINLNVVMFRDRRKGIRRVLQIAEINLEKESAKANILYRWIPESDKITRHAESTRFFEDIGRNTGLHGSELESDLREKKDILLWLIKNNVRSINQVSKVMSIYYKNRSHLINLMHKNDVSPFV